MMAYKMYPPCTLMEYHRIEQDQEVPMHLIRGTAEEEWGDDAFEIMRTTADDDRLNLSDIGNGNLIIIIFYID